MATDSSVPVEDVRIAVPWGHVAAKCWRTRDLRPVLVVHGLNDNAGSFDRLVPLLPEEYYYVVVDLPGHGLSSPFPKGVPLDFMNFVHHLQRVVRSFRWKRFVLMGHSFGAHIAEFFAATFAGEVEKLLLLEGWSPTPVAKEIFLESYVNRMKEVFEHEEEKPPRLYTYAEALSSTMNERWSKLNSEAAVALLARSLRKSDGGYVFESDPRARWEVRPPVDEDALLYVFSRIKCPVLVVLGAESEQKSLHDSPGYHKNVLEMLKKSHPRSRVVRVDGNHCLHNNNPEAVAPIIARFLREAKSNL